MDIDMTNILVFQYFSIYCPTSAKDIPWLSRTKDVHMTTARTNILIRGDMTRILGPIQKVNVMFLFCGLPILFYVAPASSPNSQGSGSSNWP